MPEVSLTEVSPTGPTMTDLGRLLAEILVAGARDPDLGARDPDLLLLAELDARYARWRRTRSGAWPYFYSARPGGHGRDPDGPPS